ncbi:MAG: ABC transporter substrate-binding protein [Spirochaetaceae bacterium]|jgi:hypothetical protein|nr:ABC transporter substrate-binding protein [Spirochaetaceae bacterium]
MTPPKYAEIVPPDLRGKLDFLAQVYCPLKKNFAESYKAFEKTYNETQEEKLSGFVPPVSWGKDPFYTIDDVKSPEQYPWAVTDTGYGEFFQGDFLQNPEKQSWFAPAPLPEGPIHPLYEHLSLKDPKGIFGIFGGFPYVFLLNLDQLKGKNPPRSISDLTKSEYEKTIAGGYGEEDISEILLMEIAKEQGERGLRSLAANIGFTGGFQEMRSAAEGNKKNIGIYLMYQAFAEEVEKKDFLEIAWPKDPLFAPLYGIYKKGPAGEQKRKAIARFLYRPETGGAMAQAGFTHIHAEVQHPIPSWVRYRWVGWDYLYEKPLPVRVQELEKIFYNSRGSYSRLY